MPERRTLAPDRRPVQAPAVFTIVPLLVYGALLLLVVAWIAHPIDNTDTYFHLRLGHEFVSGWVPWSPGHLTRFDSASWVPTQWLSQVVYAGTERAFGLGGVTFLAGALLLVYAGVMWHVIRAHSSLLLCTLLTPLVVLGSLPFLSPRPQVISFILTLVTVHVWLRASQSGRTPWVLVPLTWLWALCHGMWPVALVTSVVAVCALSVRDHDPTRNPPPRRALLSLLVAIAVVPLLTPVGPRLYGAVFLVTGRSAYFAEWSPPAFTSPDVAAVGVVCAGLIALMMRKGSAAWLPLAFTCLAAAWAVYSGRTVPVAAATAAPLLAQQLQQLLPDRGRPDRRERLLVVVLGLVAVLFLAQRTLLSDMEPDLLPGWADARLDELPRGTPVLNDWALGGYLLWRHPDLEPIAHGYGDVFTTAELDRNVTLGDAADDWQPLAKRTGAEYAILAEGSTLAYNLRLAEWTVVQEDDEWVALEAPADWLTETTR